MIEHSGTIGDHLKRLEKQSIKREYSEKDNIKIVFTYCKRFYNHYGRFPTFEKIMKITNLRRDEVRNILNILIEKGKIKRNYSYYHLPGRLKKDQNNRLKNRKIKDNNNKYTLDKFKLFILKIIIFIVGSIATLMSIYYTKIWFDTMMDFIKSLGMSLCIVGFSITAFEIIILLRNNKQKMLSFIFILLWIIVLLFSMTSTIAGQYNQFRQKQIEYLMEHNDNTYLIFQELLKEENEIKKEIKSKIIERDRFQKILNEFDSANSAEENEKKINSYRTSIYYINRDVKRLRNELKVIRNKKIKMLEENTIVENIKKEDFFQWASKIIKIKAFVIQFWLSLFPAIFIDIIAPLSFSIILFYKLGEEGE